MKQFIECLGQTDLSPIKELFKGIEKPMKIVVGVIISNCKNDKMLKTPEIIAIVPITTEKTLDFLRATAQIKSEEDIFTIKDMPNTTGTGNIDLRKII